MIRRIFLDLDDVLNTLSMFFLFRAGCKISPTDYSEYPVNGDVDLSDVANQLLGDEYHTRASFWDWFNRSDWSSVPQTPWLNWLLEQCERLVGRENIMIATSPTKDPQCAAGKVDWIQLNLPTWLHRQWAITPRKWFFARPGDLLIDDSETNCDLFRENGGDAILVPRPWNRFCNIDPAAYLIETLGRLGELQCVGT